MRSFAASFALLALVACDDEMVTGRSAPLSRTSSPVVVSTSVSAEGSEVSGRVSYKGDAKIKAKKIKMESDSFCQSAHADAVFSDEIVVSEDGSVQWALVSIKSDKLTTPAPGAAAPLNQKGCIYEPHVFGIVAGQSVKVTNGDGTTHNVHFVPKVNSLSPDNKTQKPNMEDSWVIPTPEAPFFIKCDIHPWMGAWCGVFTHNYFAVSGKDGTFTIKGLPAGKYTLEIWHEKLEGATSVEIEVDGKTPKTGVAFEYTKKK